ncbi:NACHT domain-containing protein [Streptomyces sp. NPDC050400]|uniref:NACHT domain-containing protein n=1 Tax=Streptomyces sp. NPDC050400 TaxID=3365610 RepID=UPI0037BCC1E0
MVDPGTVGVRVASSAISPLIRKLFASPGPGAALTEQPVRMSALVSFKGERRTLGPKELHRLVRELVRRTERHLAEEELDAVADALEITLYALGDLDLDDVQAVDLGHRELAARLHEQAGGARLVRFLSQDAAALYSGLLDTACLHVLHFFTQRTPFVHRTLVEQSRRLRELVDRTDLLVERLGSRPAEDAAFEQRYAAHLAKKHSSLTIYGIDLTENREWPLDAAYLSLAASAEPERSFTGSPWQEGHWSQPLAQPVEQALAGHTRVLLRGVAGSGKTTLVQWLAVTTARQSRLTGELAHLIGRVPFVLPLRTLTRKGARLPTPADFLHAVGSPLTGGQPPGWADRVLAAGRALLLVDGVDEVPDEERTRTRAWLTDLLAAYPDNLCLVTSRPSAVRQDWLGTEDFTELTLSRMSRENIAVFVGRWHEAAHADPALATALLDAIRTKHDLSALATNPLMCALICALHRERRGFLPRGRKALYDAALSLLLERRDRERDMAGAGLDLDEESQTELLQKLAYWLIRNGRSEMDRADALAQLDRLLPAMPYVARQGPADEVLNHLVTRSGLLREPAPGSLEFVHRTFQDYLGARAAVEERDFDLLLRHAHLDQWEDVLRMAVAHARPDERARLLTGLTSRGDTEPEHRTRLHLLAMACLEHASKLDPGVRAEVEERAGRLIPPHDFNEARALAEIGPVVLELLPGPEELTDPALGPYVVQAAGLIGGDAALRCMVRYRDVDSRAIRLQLGQPWSRFDTDTYGREIIDRLRYRTGATITVRTPGELTALHRLGGHDDVELIGDFATEDIWRCLGEHGLKALRVTDNALLNDLELIRRFPDLRRLVLIGCRDLPSLSPLRDLPLTELFLPDLPLSDISSLRSLTALRTLSLTAAVPESALTELSREAPLETLFVPRNTPDLSALLDFPGIEQLGLDTDTRFAPEDWRALTELGAFGR